MKKNLTWGAMFLAASVLVWGCASYGTLRSTVAQDVTIDTLLTDWQNYSVYWTGLDIGEPTGIMFDPKNDGKALTGERWYPVESQESLSKMIGWLKFNTKYYPFLWQMIGSDGQSYGYMYTGYTHFVMKLVDEKTLLVYGIPPTLRGEDRMFFDKN